MPMRCILVPIFPGLSLGHRFEDAPRIAAHAHAHATALNVRSEPAAVAASLPDFVETTGLDLATIDAGGNVADTALPLKDAARETLTIIREVVGKNVSGSRRLGC